MWAASNVARVGKDQIDRVVTERKRIGEVVVKLRDRHDVRQEALAHLAGIAWSTMQRIEYGSVSVGIDSYIKVAQALRVPLSRLFDDSESHSGGGAMGVANPGAQGGVSEVSRPEDVPEVNQE